jgi:hypothetical protein
VVAGKLDLTGSMSLLCKSWAIVEPIAAVIRGGSLSAEPKWRRRFFADGVSYA